MRLLPRSLVGQMALLIGVALLLAQLASFAYVLVQRQDFNRAAVDTPAITRFSSAAADFQQADAAFKPLVLNDSSRRGASFSIAAQPPVVPGAKPREDTRDRLRQSLANAGTAAIEVQAQLDPHPSQRRGHAGRSMSQTLVLSAQLSKGQWFIGRLSVPAPPPLITPQLVLATLLIYVFVLAASLLIAVRIAGPLRKLAKAAENFRGGREPAVVDPAGPSDLRRAIHAFNAMNARIVAQLEEKDRTLGAIGHDLRTPLASLRIRAESVEPASESEAMVKTIEEMTGTLEDILDLARSGHSREPIEEIDVGSLLGELVEEYRRGGLPVSVEGTGVHVRAQPNLLRRAVRNLIDNALKYAGAAEVELSKAAGGASIAVLDRGPGMPEEALEQAPEAFYRAEPSRNRETGGAGLGLAIVKAIVAAQGGRLQLRNRQGGGLAAVIELPE